MIGALLRYTPPNKSFERTARQLASHQSCAVSLRLCAAGGQPLNSSVGHLTVAMKGLLTIVFVLACLSPAFSGQTGDNHFVEQPLSNAIDHSQEKFGGRRDYLIDGRQVKSKSKVLYTGDTRAVDSKKKRFLELWLEARQLSPKTLDLLLQEVRFREGDKDYWLPVRKKVLGDMSVKLKNGDAVTIHTILAGGVVSGDSVEWVFIVGDFSP